VTNRPAKLPTASTDFGDSKRIDAVILPMIYRPQVERERAMRIAAQALLFVGELPGLALKCPSSLPIWIILDD